MNSKKLNFNKKRIKMGMEKGLKKRMMIGMQIIMKIINPS